MAKPVSERRYPHEPQHNLPPYRQALIERAQREARESGVEFDNAQHSIVYDPDEGMLVITLYGTD